MLHVGQANRVTSSRPLQLGHWLGKRDMAFLLLE
jgi:hypothetical protein